MKKSRYTDSQIISILKTVNFRGHYHVTAKDRRVFDTLAKPSRHYT